MVIYEVNLKINKEIYAEYQSWLVDHVKDILKLPGFVKATFLQELSDPEVQEEGQEKITVQYQLHSWEDLQQYFENHAPQMRADGLKRFKDGFTATRRTFQQGDTLLAA